MLSKFVIWYCRDTKPAALICSIEMKIIFSTTYVKELLKISIYGTKTLQVLEQLIQKFKYEV